MPWHVETGRTMQGLTWLFLLEFLLYVMALQPGFLDFDNLPDTNFTCIGKVIGGYYADLETNCQMFHVCTIGQLDEPMDIRFLCLNGTVFDQETRVCERIDEVDCTKSEKFYSLNLELYGNTQPPIAEESPEVDIQKISTTTTTTTSTTTPKPVYQKSTATENRVSSTILPSTIDFKTVITSHHFPIANTHDIRFDPEEINISLNSAASDAAKTQVPISYQQQSFDSDEKSSIATVTTHTTNYKIDKPHRVSLLPTQNPQSIEDDENLESPKVAENSQTPKSVVSYDLTHHHASPTEINYGFTNLQTENSRYPIGDYNYRSNINGLRPPSVPIHPYVFQFQTTTKRTPKFNFPALPRYTTPSSEKQFHHNQFNLPTKKTPQLQPLPIPLFPTLPPLSFSSPAPFGFGNHIETKRYTNDHHSPPRIIISASASVSDNNGRRLNYSLGTIGAGHILASPPTTYDDYKEEDVALDPFYHDVPKVKTSRRRRSATLENDDEDSDDILKFLFDWYVKRKNRLEISIPIRAEDITQINQQLAPIIVEDSIENSPKENYSASNSTLKINSTDSKKVNFQTIRDRRLNSYENYPRGNLHPRLSNAHFSGGHRNARLKENSQKAIITTNDYTDKVSSRRMDNALDGSEVLKSVYAILDSANFDNLNEEHAADNKDRITKGRTTKSVDSLSFNPNRFTTALPFENTQPSQTFTHYDNGKENITEITTENHTLLLNVSIPDGAYLATSTEFPAIFTDATPTNKSVNLAEPLEILLETTVNPDITIYDYYNDELNSTDASKLVMFEDPSVKFFPHYNNSGQNFLEEQPRLINSNKPDGVDLETTTSMSFISTDTAPSNKSLNLGEALEIALETTLKPDSIMYEYYDDELNTTGRSNTDILEESFQKPTPIVNDSSSLTNIGKDVNLVTQNALLSQELHNNTRDIKTDFEHSILPEYVDDNYEPLTYTLQTVKTTSLISKEHKVTVTTELPVSAEYQTVFNVEVTTIEPKKPPQTTNTYEDNMSTVFTTEAVPKTTFGEDMRTSSYSESSVGSSSLPDIYPTYLMKDSTSMIKIEDSTSSFSSSITTQLDVLSTTELETISTTTPLLKTTSSRSRSRFLSTRPALYRGRDSAKRWDNNRHRFSSLNHRKGTRKKDKLVDSTETSVPIKTSSINIANIELSVSVSNISNKTNIAKLSDSTIVSDNTSANNTDSNVSQTLINKELPFSSVNTTTDELLTDAPLSKSAIPTRTKYTTLSVSTTPVSKLLGIQLGKDVQKEKYIFNCFGKKIHKFYSDPRDCRLFHYCTTGYRINQLVDMKFVCDLGTYFDEEKFICSEAKPAKCV